MDIKEITKCVDHTLLNPTSTWAEIRELCDDAVNYGTASVCIPPCYVKQAKEYVQDKMAVCTVVGFPNGYAATATKMFETEEALKEATSQIIDTIHSVLEKTPPELAADIADRGIVLTGGGSLLRGLEDLIYAKTGINTMTAEDPMTCVAIGTGKYVEFLAGYRDEIQ